MDEMRFAFADAFAFHSGTLTPRAYGVMCELQGYANLDPDGALALCEAVGNLEGIYALLYTRRERIDTLMQNDVDEWAQDFAALVNKEDVLKIVKQFGEASKDQRQNIRDMLQALFASILANNAAEASSLRAMVKQYLVMGNAEGRVSGKTLVANKLGGKQPNLDDLYDETYKVVNAHSDQMSDNINQTQTAMIGGLAGDIALAGSDLNSNSSVRDALVAGAGLAFYLSYFTHGAYTDGQATTYSQAGIGLVNWVTVGDGRVCVTCMGYEAGGPYPVTDAPSPPAHGLCRCWLTPA